jgi:hypothetical protein
MNHIKSTRQNTTDLTTSCQDNKELENNRAFRIKPRKPKLRALEQEKSNFPSLILTKNSTNFKASFVSVLEKSSKNPVGKNKLRAKIPMKKTEKRKSISCPVEVQLKDSFVLNPKIFSKLRGDSIRIRRDRIKRNEPSRGLSLVAHPLRSNYG